MNVKKGKQGFQPTRATPALPTSSPVPASTSEKGSETALSDVAGMHARFTETRSSDEVRLADIETAEVYLPEYYTEHRIFGEDDKDWLINRVKQLEAEIAENRNHE